MRPGQAAPVFKPRWLTWSDARAGFNEAGQAAPVFTGASSSSGGPCVASMRPGQAAPVFRKASTQGCPLGGSFNEAGAGCPGIHLFDATHEAIVAALQ